MFDDPNLSELSEESLPDFAKQATVKPIEDYDRFALTYMTKEGEVRQKYPIDDDAMTWCSAQYFDANHENLSQKGRAVAASNIKEAAERFGINTNQFEALDEFYVESESGRQILKEGQAIEEHLPEVEQSSYYLLPKQQKYPADTPDQIKRAQHYFEKHASDLKIDERRKFARRLVNRARETDVELDEDTKRYASEKKAQEEQIKLAFETRKQHVGPGMEDKLDTIYQNRERIPADVMTEALREFDKKAEITHLWDKSIPDPDQSVRSSKLKDEKKEAAQNIVYEGVSINSDDIRQISNDKLSNYFSENQIKELNDNPQVVFEALPDQHKEIIVSLVQETQ